MRRGCVARTGRGVRRSGANEGAQRHGANYRSAKKSGPPERNADRVLFFRIFEGTSAFPWKDVELYLCPSTSSQNNGGKPCNEKRDNRERES